MDSKKEKIIKFIQMEEEDDDELFLVIVPAILECLNEEKRSEHTSEYTGAKKVKEILEGHENWCKSEFRIETRIFKETCNYLRHESLLRDTQGVTVEEQLGMFMYMISHNASNDRLKKAFQHSGETVLRHIRAVFNIIPTLTYRFLNLPTSNQTHPKIAMDPRFWSFFRIVLVLSTAHMCLSQLQKRKPPYRNRKGTLSQNVMVAYDFNLNFTFISCGWEGSASDAGVLQSAISKGFQVPEGKFYLVDGGYANAPQFRAPYQGVRYHIAEFRRRSSRRREYADHKELFNHHHALLRNHIDW
ncbi:uncharacterized protein [Miscanthus floridulus]|uniref:uncharacterized protein n=1 Tax=Miscanthus floridulus TaxID=154761 RepID=UPI00345B4C27